MDDGKWKNHFKYLDTKNKKPALPPTLLGRRGRLSANTIK